MTEALAIVVIAAIALIAIAGVQASTGVFDNMSGFAAFQQNPQVTYKIQSFAEGISHAENTDPVHNNPCAITPPGWQGPTFGAGIAEYATIDEGWMRGYYELSLIVTGKSTVYSLTETISQMAHKWTATNPDDWAATVAQYTGYTINTTLQEALV